MIVQAYLTASSLNGLARSEIMYMPAGRSTIQARVGGEPKELDVNVSSRTAEILQAELAKLLAGHVRPYIDFDHQGGPAAAIPKRFRWVPGRGVMLELEWTRSGKQSVEGRDYSYFSPSFQIGANGEPAGLPESGAIGALTNNPAFRDIERIAATHSSVKSVREDPIGRMQAQRRVIAHFRSAHPDIHTEEVFRQLSRLNPSYFKD
jgi:phage I-like protein